MADEEKIMFYVYMIFKDLIKKYFDLWEKRFCEKGTFLFEYGKPARGIYFCESGIARAYTIKEKKDETIEITNRFFSENDPIIPFTNLIRNRPVRANVQVIESGVFYFITNENFEIIAKQEPNIKGILMEVMMCILDYANDYQYTAYDDFQDRYEMWCEKYPYLERVPDKYVATFFGVDRTTVARRKAELKKKNKRPKK